MAKFAKGVTPRPVKHPATYNGRHYDLSTTDWSRMIGCPVSQVDRGLKKHYSMQAYLDECHAETQQIHKHLYQFLFSGATHT